MDLLLNHPKRPASQRMWTALGAAALILLSAAIYWQTGKFGFVDFDDDRYVTLNPYVQAGFTSGSIHYAFTATFGGWSPLLWISYLIDRQFFSASPGVMHLENAVLHSATGILLWAFLTIATGSSRRSYMVAALFICHPMHVESVAWISERKDVLSTPLLLAAIIAYCRYCRLPSGGRRYFSYGILLICFMLSLLTKAMGVTLPLLLLLLDYWPLSRLRTPTVNNRIRQGLILEKLPLLAISLVFAIVAFHSQSVSGAVRSVANLGHVDRIENAVVCYCLYLLKLVAPIGLAVFYPHPVHPPMSATIVAAFFLAVITWISVISRRQTPFLLVGWLWFLVSLLPVIGLVQIGQQAMADRYSYLPSIGVLMAIVWQFDRIVARLFSSRVLAAGLSMACGAIAVAWLSILSWRQVTYWKNTSILFAHSLEVTGPNTEVYLLLGRAAYENGDPREAVDDFNRMLQIDPDSADALDGLGSCWSASDPRKAIAFCRRAIAISPRPARYHLNLAAALSRAGDVDESEQQVKTAISLEPDLPEAQAAFAKLQNRSKAK